MHHNSLCPLEIYCTVLCATYHFFIVQYNLLADNLDTYSAYL